MEKDNFAQLFLFIKNSLFGRVGENFKLFIIGLVLSTFLFGVYANIKTQDVLIATRPIKQVMGGISQRFFNPFIRYPSKEDLSINPIFDKKFIPTITQNPSLQQMADNILKEYTLTAKFQMESIPVGEFDAALAGVHGKSLLGATVPGYNGELLGGGYNRGGFAQATYIRNNLPQAIQIKALRHVLLHTALVNAGGLNTEEFLKDLERLKNFNPKLFQKVKKFSESPFYTGIPKQLLAEEMFSQLGAWEGPKIFLTPVGRHYQWILKKPE